MYILGQLYVIFLVKVLATHAPNHVFEKEHKNGWWRTRQIICSIEARKNEESWVIHAPNLLFGRHAKTTTSATGADTWKWQMGSKKARKKRMLTYASNHVFEKGTQKRMVTHAPNHARAESCVQKGMRKLMVTHATNHVFEKGTRKRMLTHAPNHERHAKTDGDSRYKSHTRRIMCSKEARVMTNGRRTRLIKVTSTSVPRLFWIVRFHLAQ